MLSFAMDAVVARNETIAEGVKELVVEAAPIASKARAGQFVHVSLGCGELLLRRPLSLSLIDPKSDRLHIVYRIVGKGTAFLAEKKAAETLNLLGPLGRGFDLNCENALLVGGGMGIAPLQSAAMALGAHKTSILMGGRNKEELFWRDLYKGLVREMFFTTDDGSLGVKGFAAALVPELLENGGYDRGFACGPQPMLESVVQIARRYRTPCQVSLEKRMACGLGACLSCTFESADGTGRKKVCKDGPVFWAEEVF